MVVALIFAGTASAQSPYIKFSDLESGPKTGGQSNKGAFVTIYGMDFGDTRGTSFVTVGGGPADNYPIWTNWRVTFQLGPLATSGSIVMNVNGRVSNGLPFTVRAGNIYFVSTTGRDADPGTFASPWRTILKAKNAIAAGDIAYVMHGVSQTAEDNYEAALSIENSGTAGAPKALVVYPGAGATIGSTSTTYGFRVPNIDVAGRDWVIAGFHIVGWQSAISLGGNTPQRWRIIGNRISCPPGEGLTGCVSTSVASHIKFLGNEVTDTGRQPASNKQYHAVYFSTDSNNIEAGWNWIHNNRTCHAIQFHSSPLCQPSCGSDQTGRNQYALSVHDNLIHGDLCSGVNFATVDPSRGTVEAYNNVIFDVGNGPQPTDGLSGANCIYSPGYTNNGAQGSGSILVRQNTCYNVGRADTAGRGGAFWHAGPTALRMDLRNNIVYQPASDYLAEASQTNNIVGSHNLWFGQGAGPSFLTNNINADPQFVDTASRNFYLRTTSPAVNSGLNLGITRDIDGIARAVPDRGAREMPQAAGDLIFYCAF
jgi:hypothetical protein